MHIKLLCLFFRFVRKFNENSTDSLFAFITLSMLCLCGFSSNSKSNRKLPITFNLFQLNQQIFFQRTGSIEMMHSISLSLLVLSCIFSFCFSGQRISENHQRICMEIYAIHLKYKKSYYDDS